MAQGKKKSMRVGMRSLARRYGLTARSAVMGVVGVVTLVAAFVGGFGLLEGRGAEIARGSEVDTTTSGITESMASIDADHGSGEDAKPNVAAEKDVSTSAQMSSSEAPTRRLVHVDGAVATPGVYVLDGTDPRVNDAVLMAGGLGPEADTSQVNLAAPVEDGQKVHIPTYDELVAQPVGQPGATDLAAGPNMEDGESGLVNINSATTEQLCTLPGVGEATAEAIIEERTANGPFTSIEDVMRVSGIGEKKFQKMQGQICV